MKILLTGASSFTGYWFAKALHESGNQVVAALHNKIDYYSTGVRAERVKRLKHFVEIIDDCKFGEKKFFDLISSQEFDLLCHHAAYVNDYHNPEFNVIFAVNENTNNLSNIIAQMIKKGLKGIILTGSIFEPNEGIGTIPMRAFSAYGLSKGITASIFEFQCHNAKIPFGKFVIPNPFGPFEEERFCCYLIKTWKAGNTPIIKTPLYVRDNIHVEYLSIAYAKFINQVINKNSYLKINPSGYIGSQGDFAVKFSIEMQSRLNIDCKVELGIQNIFNEPHVRINTENIADYIEIYNDSIMWDNLASYYKEFYLS